MQTDVQHGLRVRRASLRWGPHQLRGVNGRGQELCSMELLFTSILKQVPASSKSPKEGPTLLISARCHESNVSKCKQCRQEQQIALMHSDTGRMHRYSRANCIPDMYIHTCVYREGDRCASICLHLSQSVLSVHGTWSTFL